MSPLDHSRYKPPRYTGTRWVAPQGQADPEPAPAVVRSPWEGISIFTAHDPAVALPLCPYVDTVVLKGDGGDHSDEATAERFKAAGARVRWWYSWDQPAHRWSIDGDTIGQAEGPGQREFCENLALKATVTNVTFTDDPWLGAFEAVFTECYLNTNPNARPDVMEYEARKRGAKVVIPCFGVGLWGEANGRSVSLFNYLTQVGVGDSWSVYLAETMTDADVDALKLWREKHPKVIS